MSQTTQNQQWPMVAELYPQLRRHLETYSQMYRGERWYVFRDGVSGRHVRFNAGAYELIGRLDGERSVQEIWELLQASQGDNALTQDEVIQILTQLFAIDALRSGLPADAKALFKRAPKRTAAGGFSRIMFATSRALVISSSGSVT